MTYKEFREWCNDRAADGCWSMTTAITCTEILKEIESQPFWRRKKFWREEYERAVYDNIVSPINRKIDEEIAKQMVVSKYDCNHCISYDEKPTECDKDCESQTDEFRLQELANNLSRIFNDESHDDKYLVAAKHLIESGYQKIYEAVWIPQDETLTKFMCSHCHSKNHEGIPGYCLSCGSHIRSQKIN